MQRSDLAIAVNQGRADRDLGLAIGASIEIVTGYLLIGDIVEIVHLVANLVRVPQRDAEEPLAVRFQRNDVLARREYRRTFAPRAPRRSVDR
jgi:hypothetical protein